MAAPAHVRAASRRVMDTCACEGSRRTARALTQLYDDALAPSGVRATQVPILAALAVVGPAPLTPLAERLGMDRTTLTRNLRGLRDGGLVAIEPGEDRRTRFVALTDAGAGALGRALELWERAQADVAQRFGAERLEHALGELSALRAAVRG
jgi:DNA-binding MarR family transcriptional regulator